MTGEAVVLVVVVALAAKTEKMPAHSRRSWYKYWFWSPTQTPTLVRRKNDASVATRAEDTQDYSYYYPNLRRCLRHRVCVVVSETQTEPEGVHETGLRHWTLSHPSVA